jgi:Fur family ferric uptake transcriptional regulator
VPRRTGPRERIVTELQQLDTFIAAQALYTRLALAGDRISMSTVYRTLHLLVGLGRVDVMSDGHGQRLYRHRPGLTHFHYLTCRRCGLARAVEASVVEDWAEQVRAAHGFAHLDHKVELSGVCGPCADETH